MSIQDRSRMTPIYVQSGDPLETSLAETRETETPFFHTSPHLTYLNFGRWFNIQKKNQDQQVYHLVHLTYDEVTKQVTKY